MARKPLPVPNGPRKGGQSQRLCYRIQTAIKRSGLTVPELQPALEEPGTGLEDEILEVLVRRSKWARGIYKPLPAYATGLIPSDMTLAGDDVEEEVDINNLDFSTEAPPEGKPWIHSAQLLQRAEKLEVIGSLGFGKLLLDKQREGKDIIPPDLDKEHTILLPRTRLLHRGGSPFMCYIRNTGTRWILSVRLADPQSAFYPHEHFVRVGR